MRFRGVGLSPLRAPRYPARACGKVDARVSRVHVKEGPAWACRPGGWPLARTRVCGAVARRASVHPRGNTLDGENGENSSAWGRSPISPLEFAGDPGGLRRGAWRVGSADSQSDDGLRAPADRWLAYGWHVKRSRSQSSPASSLSPNCLAPGLPVPGNVRDSDCRYLGS